MHEELLKVQHGINQIEEWCILVQENIILVIYLCSYIFIGTHHIYRFIIYQLIKTLPRVSKKKKKKTLPRSWYKNKTLSSKNDVVKEISF